MSVAHVASRRTVYLNLSAAFVVNPKLMVAKPRRSLNIPYLARLDCNLIIVLVLAVLYSYRVRSAADNVVGVLDRLTAQIFLYIFRLGKQLCVKRSFGGAIIQL